MRHVTTQSHLERVGGDRSLVDVAQRVQVLRRRALDARRGLGH